MPGVFDYVNSINNSKDDLFTAEKESEADKIYVPFIVNRSFSYFVDSILYSNEINQYPHLTSKQQYHYLLHSLPKGKRFSKWSKKEITDDLKSVSEYFQCNLTKSAEILKIINKNDLGMIKQQLQKGGVQE